MNFAEIIRSSQRLRHSFDRVSGFALWWRIVLALHGKPVSDGLTDEAWLATLVRGFRFYGYLYLGLGLVLGAGTAIWIVLDQSSPWYWMAMSGFGAVYLIASSLLAFQGADAFGAGEARGAVLLVAFFVFVIVFLAAFGAFLSSSLHGEGNGPDLFNVALFAAFILFGIGSYLIELVYLTWWKAGDPADQTADPAHAASGVVPPGKSRLMPPSKYPFYASKYPCLTKFLQSTGDKTSTRIVVLREEGYESAFGDGTSYDLWEVFSSREDAELAIDRDRAAGSEEYRMWTRYHLRTMSVALRGAELDFAIVYSDPNDSFLDGLYAAFSAADVMRMLERRHAS